MKVVLFCGGYGMRMLGWSGEGLPKPLQLVGDLPLVVHVMSHYAAYGHTDFVLCLGHAADQIQDAVSLVVANHPRPATGTSNTSTPAWTPRSGSGCGWPGTS